jgi:hydroxyacylglutathione hydrolase
VKFYSLFASIGFSNTYLLGPDGGGDALLIDPGAFDAPLLQAVESNHLYVRSILVTHAHNAHINGIRSLLKVYSADIYANQPSVLDVPARHVQEGDTLALGEFRVRIIE